VLIGDLSAIDFQAQSERSVLLKPLSLGTANPFFVDQQGIVVANLTVVARSAGRFEYAWIRRGSKAEV
jgi:hypothetical protein